jgi:hypothetical protein
MIFLLTIFGKRFAREKRCGMHRETPEHNSK